MGRKEPVAGDDNSSAMTKGGRKSKLVIDEEKPEAVFAAKKKSKEKKRGANSGLLGAEDNNALTCDTDVEDEPVASFTGKKTLSKKVISWFSAASFAFDVLEDDDDYEAAADDYDTPVIEFTGKNMSSNEEEKDNEDEDLDATIFSGKKKKKKKKKKKNKSGRIPHEEEDLDKILKELGGVEVEAPSTEESVLVKTETIADECEEDKVSAAAKKKKKKKWKEKKKEAAAKEEKEAEKKVPKHIREIQELICRRKEMEERKAMEEEDKRRKEEEEIHRQEEHEKQAKEAKRRKKEREKEKILKKKQEGKILTKKLKEQQCRLEAMRNQILANAGMLSIPKDKEGAPTKRPKYQTKKSKSSAKLEESIKVEQRDDAEPKVEDDDDDEEWDAKCWDDVNLNVKRAFDDEEIDSEKQINVPMPEQAENLRSPICCVLGHVDAGKTKLLDCIRGTHVQKNEAGGITQQIGATFFPIENISERIGDLKSDSNFKVPGLLVIDTPGHKSFANLRSRGSGLCDIAILVVDIMKGLKPQTIESLNLFKMRNTKFIVALNKVDRLYGWKAYPNESMEKALKQQSKDVQNEFKWKLTKVVNQFKEQGFNTELCYDKRKSKDAYIIVPTSAISGEGVPDLLLLLVEITQKTMVEKLTFSSEVQCTVLEVKVVEGHGTTIDVVLVNGVLRKGDQIVVCGMQGPIVTTIRALLTPHPMKEIRVKGAYIHHKEIKAAQGIKISAQGLEHAIAGTSLHVVGPKDDLEHVKAAVMEDINCFMSRIDKSGEGVYVQASTLGSLEALLEFLKSSSAERIPVIGIGIGPVHKKNVIKASIMLEKKKEYATILAFDVKVTQEAKQLADKMGVKIFVSDIIYHLFKKFKAYLNNLKEEKKEAILPCILQILPNCIFNKKDPIILGVEVIAGIAKVGIPICVPARDFIDIGQIDSIELNDGLVDYAKKGQKVAIKIVGRNSEQQKRFGRHFDIDDELVSHISRRSIDSLNAFYRNDLSTEDWKLVAQLKKVFNII